MTKIFLSIKDILYVGCVYLNSALHLVWLFYGRAYKILRYFTIPSMVCVCVCVCVPACVHACVRACMCACMCTLTSSKLLEGFSKNLQVAVGLVLSVGVVW